MGNAWAELMRLAHLIEQLRVRIQLLEDRLKAAENSQISQWMSQ